MGYPNFIEWWLFAQQRLLRNFGLLRKREYKILFYTCGNKMPTRCNRGFYCRSYCLLNMFRASLCPSSGAQEEFHIQSLHQAHKLIPEQCLNDPNPLFELAFSHPHHTYHKTEPVNQHPANRTHNPLLHTRPRT